MNDYYSMCVFFSAVSFLALIWVVYQVAVSSRTLAEFRTFEDYALSYNRIVDPFLKQKVHDILLDFLKRDQRYLVRSPRSWERLGKYMERVRAYNSIVERGQYSPETVSSETLHIECAEFLKSACGNWFSFLDSPETTRNRAEKALELLQSSGAFLADDPAYVLLQDTFGKQVLLFMRLPLRQEYLGFSKVGDSPIPQDFLERVSSLGFTLDDINYSHVR